MEQTFIKVSTVDGERYDKDIRYTTEAEREEYYIDQTAGQLSRIIEKLLGFEDKE